MELNLNWTPPKVVQTKYGERTVRTAPATPEFWTLYKTKRDELFKAGYSVKKNDWTGEWTVTHWGELPKEVIEQKQATLEASRATDANFDPPAPEGKEYFPFQKAGIKFACEREATLIGDDMGLGKTVQAVGVLNATSPRTVLVVCPATLKLVWKQFFEEWLVRDYTLVMPQGSKCSPDVRDALQRLLSLNDHIWFNGEKKVEYIGSTTNSPHPLHLNTLDGTAPKGFVTALVNYTTKLSEPINNGLVGTSKRDGPRLIRGASTVRRDPTLAINDSSHVSKMGRVSRRGKGSSTSSSETQRVPHQSLEIIAKGGLFDSETTAYIRDFLSCLNTLESSKEIVIGNASGTSHVIILINYDIFASWKEVLGCHYFDYLVADEAHYLKNPKAQRTKALLGYEPGKREKTQAVAPVQAKRRVLMTGTPIVNRPIELWPLLHYLDPKTWKNFFGYAKRYTNARHNGYGWDFSGASNLEELQRRLRETIMVRRLKDEVLTDLPPKIRQVVVLPANGASDVVRAENEAYESHEEKIAQLRAAVELAKASDDPTEYTRAVERLRDEVEAAFEELAKLRHETALAKVPYIVEHLENVSGKVVIMCYHLDVVRTLKEHLGEAAVVLTGETPMAERKLAEDRFQKDPDVQYFIGTIRAAGVGITLTASAHIIFAELDWVPGNVSQAEDRCRRIGQTSSVLVQHLVLDGSLDARMARVLVAKQEVIDKALDNELPELETPKFEMFVKGDLATKDAKREALEEEGKALSADQVEAIHQCLKILAGLDSDRASMQNEIGFNKIDGRIGHSLAEFPVLTQRQAALGRKIILKYHRQLPSTLYALIFPERVQ